MIEVKNLTKQYSKKENVILNDISFSIFDGDKVALLGENGAGKTTLMEILAQLDKKYKGDITFDKSHKLGAQFQVSSFPSGLRVFNIIKFAVKLNEVKLSKAQFESLLKIYGVDKFYKKKAKSLSGGQKQKLSLLMAGISNPEVLFLDEPVTGLDLSSRKSIKNIINRGMESKETTLLMITHNVDDIMDLCNRVIVLENGKIAEDFKITSKVSRKSLSELLAKYTKGDNDDEEIEKHVENFLGWTPKDGKHE